MFLYEILILIKSININDRCFQVITNQTNFVFIKKINDICLLYCLCHWNR